MKSRLKKIQRESNSPWETIELDYALSWVLNAISCLPEVRESLIFKGGTCLKKCYFGDYRYSEDLDFTAPKSISDDVLNNYVTQIADLASRQSQAQGNGIEFSVEHYKEREPHPNFQKAYIVRGQYEWHREPLTKIKLEISRDEKLMYEPREKPILHEYGEIFNKTLRVYALEEILAEKYRGILQNQERLKERSWVRSRVRDFYDLWRILSDFKGDVDLTYFTKNFVEKCRIKGIVFAGPDQFFDNKDYLDKVHHDWDQFLGVLVKDLPSFYEEMIPNLRKLTKEVFNEPNINVILEEEENIKKVVMD